jgi:hypothetical protein
VPLEPCHCCTSGCPSAGCNQILSAPIPSLGPFLLFLFGYYIIIILRDKCVNNAHI